MLVSEGEMPTAVANLFTDLATLFVSQRSLTTKNGDRVTESFGSVLNQSLTRAPESFPPFEPDAAELEFDNGFPVSPTAIPFPVPVDLKPSTIPAPIESGIVIGTGLAGDAVQVDALLARASIESGPLEGSTSFTDATLVPTPGALVENGFKRAVASALQSHTTEGSFATQATLLKSPPLDQGDGNAPIRVAELEILRSVVNTAAGNIGVVSVPPVAVDSPPAVRNSAIPFAPTTNPVTPPANALRPTTIPAQVSVVSDLIPRPTASPIAEADTPSAPQAAEAFGSIPDARVGDRPTTAGNRLAAIISSASLLTMPKSEPTATSFGAVLTQSEPTHTGVVSRVTDVVANPASLETFARAGVPLAERTDRFEPRIPTEATPVAVNSNNAFGPSFLTLRTAAESGKIHTAVDVQSAATQLGDGILARTTTLNRDGRLEFHMRLDPPELGPLQVRLMSNGDEIRGFVVAADDTARRIIESQLPELRAKLEASGLNLGSFEVIAGGAGRGQWNMNQQPGHAESRLQVLELAAPRPRTNTISATGLDVIV